MNEELEKQTADALGGIIERLGRAEDFVITEAPEVIQQLLMWKTFSYSAMLVGGIILFIAWIPILRSSIKIWVECESPVLVIMTSWFSIIMPIVSVWLFICGMNLFKVLLAPKIFLIEYAASLIN